MWKGSFSYQDTLEKTQEVCEGLRKYRESVAIFLVKFTTEILSENHQVRGSVDFLYTCQKKKAQSIRIFTKVHCVLCASGVYALRGAVDAIARKMDSKCDMHKVRSENCADETYILNYCT